MLVRDRYPAATPGGNSDVTVVSADDTASTHTPQS
jgi:hypothetical protein